LRAGFQFRARFTDKFVSLNAQAVHGDGMILKAHFGKVHQTLLVCRDESLRLRVIFISLLRHFFASDVEVSTFLLSILGKVLMLN
jgi:hypothetical protein